MKANMTDKLSPAQRASLIDIISGSMASVWMDSGKKFGDMAEEVIARLDEAGFEITLKEQE